jgi:ABC-type branched-subunit amino acid transport system substrate-binding protein
MGMIMKRILLVMLMLTSLSAWSQKPGTTPVKVSSETQMLHGRKYYVHIVERGQTVYTISKAYKVLSYDAVTHVDIHALHPGDTVWLPFRGQFTDSEEPSTPTPAPTTVSVPQINTVHDTSYIYVHDTTYVNVPYAVHDTTYVNVPHVVHDTIYVNVPHVVHDTTYVNVPHVVHDTTYVNVPHVVHDTSYVNVPYVVHDTTYVFDTVTQTEYLTVHDTAFITDTVMLTKYMPVHDTTYVTLHDTAYIKVPYAVHDTTVVSDKVMQTEYVTVHDTTYIDVPYAVYDTTVVTDTVTLTKYVPVHDTTYITLHDTMFVVDTVDFTPSSDLAFASSSAVALTAPVAASQPAARADNSATEQTQRKAGKTLKVALMMPLHLDQLDQISTSKFDVEQRGKRSYRQFEFIEFYEGLLLALDKLAEQGVSVELNVADVSGNTPAHVEEAFLSHHVDQCDFVVALLLRDCFDKAAELARQAGVYIVNPMATRSELCSENPYMVKIQPSLKGMIALMLNNMKFERPDAHLYIIHSNSKDEKAAMDELKRQLTERGDIKYTIFNWSQSARLVSVMKATPRCNVLSIYDQGKDNNRVYSINLLNRLSSIKKDSPTLYTLTDWTREYNDIDFAQLQLLGYHTYSLAWDMTNDVHVQFLQSFRNRFGSEPTSQLAATAYDLMLYIGGGLARRNSDFWLTPGNSLPTLVQPLHLGRSGAGLENDKAQLYRLDDLRFIKALFK